MSFEINREKSNLGGINQFSFILESNLSDEIEIIKGQVKEIQISSPGFITAQFVNESSKFIETKKGLTLFEYSFTARIATNSYSRLQDCNLFDSNRIIALVKDNDNEIRVLGQKNNACELSVIFDKGEKVSDLNHYKIELKWTSRYRAPIFDNNQIIPIYVQDENGDFIAIEQGPGNNQLSSMDEAETIEGGFCYIILPDLSNPGKFKSYKISIAELSQLGEDGKSAYQIAVDNGFSGTVQQWLDSLVGADGQQGAQGANGSDGKSAYQVAVDNGFEGTVQQWLTSLIGADGQQGAQGANGSDGKSAYQVAVDNGFEGTVQQWLTSLIGEDGAQGPQGNTGPQGQTGATGAMGQTGAQGAKGDTGDVGNISDYTEKTDLNDDDKFLEEDSTISSPKTKKFVKWSLIKSKILSYVLGQTPVKRGFSFNDSATLAIDYYPENTSITVIALTNISTLEYSTDGINFTALTLPGSLPLAITAGAIYWRITYSSGKSQGFVAITGTK